MQEEKGGMRYTSFFAMVCITLSSSFFLIYYAFGSPIQYCAGKLISASKQNFIFQFTQVMHELC